MTQVLLITDQHPYYRSSQKYLKKLFDKRLTEFIEKSNILSNSQYGFRNERSTSLALLDFMEKLGSAKDKNLVTRAVTGAEKRHRVLAL